MGYAHELFLRSSPELLKNMEREEDRKRLSIEPGTGVAQEQSETSQSEAAGERQSPQKPGLGGIEGFETQAGILRSIQQHQANQRMRQGLGPHGIGTQGLLGTELLALQAGAHSMGGLRATGIGLPQPGFARRASPPSSGPLSMQQQLTASLIAQQEVDAQRDQRALNLLRMQGGEAALGQAGMTESDILQFRFRQARQQQQRTQLPTARAELAHFLAAQQQPSSADPLQSRLVLERSLGRSESPASAAAAASSLARQSSFTTLATNPLARQSSLPTLSTNPLFSNLLGGQSGLLASAGTATTPSLSRAGDPNVQRWLLLREQEQQQQQIVHDQLRQQRHQQLQQLAQEEMLQLQQQRQLAQLQPLASASRLHPHAAPSLGLSLASYAGARPPAPTLSLADQLLRLDRDRILQQQSREQQQDGEQKAD